VKPTVVVPATAFSYPDRRRLFYRVIPGDNLRGVAGVFGVSADDLCRWNLLDPGASLHDGMTLQVFAPKGRSLGNVLAIDERDARVLLAGSTEFFAHFEAQRGRARMEVVAKEGDTWRTLARHYGLTMGQMERINQKARSSALTPGDKLVVYVPTARVPAPKGAPEEKAEDAVAVAKPVGDDVVQQAKEEDGVKPAVLEKPGVPEPIPEKGAPPAGKGAAEKPAGAGEKGT
jgi:membrane-bound lytic murein transglycosylase D